MGWLIRKQIEAQDEWQEAVTSGREPSSRTKVKQKVTGAALNNGCFVFLVALVVIVLVLAACGAEATSEPTLTTIREEAGNPLPTVEDVPTVEVDAWNCGFCWGTDMDGRPVCMDVGRCHTEGCCE